jgi:hypothetical protein
LARKVNFWPTTAAKSSTGMSHSASAAGSVSASQTTAGR